MVDRMDDGGDGTQQELDMAVAVNNLNYTLEPDLSVANHATYKKHFFSQDSYDPNRQAICILNSGADYLDFRRSYLSFDFELTVNGQKDVALPFDTSKQRAAGAVNSRLCIKPGSITNVSTVDCLANVSALPEPRRATTEASGTVFLKGATAIGTQGIDIGFGNGSACNLINRITVQSRSGDEICRIENSAMLSHVLTNYCYNQEWASTVGSGFGMHPAAKKCADGQAKEDYFYWKNVTHTAQTKKRFHIPLYLLTGFFNYDRLMPSMLCSGLRISIEWNEAAVALVFGTDPSPIMTAGTVLSWETSKVTLDMKSIQLTDACQRYLNEVSATTGLEIVFTDYNHTGTNVVGSGSEVHTEVRQACSRALRAFARIRDQDAARNPCQDSFAADYWMVPSYQWRLGSLYFPQQPVAAKNITSWKESSMGIDAPDTLYSQYLKYTQNTYNAAVSTQRTYFDLGAGDTQRFQMFYPIDQHSGYTTILAGKKSGPKHLDNITEAYYHALEMFGKYNGKTGDTNVTLEQFTDGEIPLVEGTPAHTTRYHSDPRGGPIRYIESTKDGYKGSQQIDAQTDRAEALSKSSLHGYFNSHYAKNRQTKKELMKSLITSHSGHGEAVRSDAFSTVLTDGVSYEQPANGLDLYKNAFMKCTSYTNYPGSQAIIPVNLERSTLFALSGVPINNSRVLGLDYTMADRLFGQVLSVTANTDGVAVNVAGANPGNDLVVGDRTGNIDFTATDVRYPRVSGNFQHTTSIFLQYVKIARVFLNNVEVEQ